MPDPIAPAAPDVEIDAGSFASALASTVPQPGAPPQQLPQADPTPPPAADPAPAAELKPEENKPAADAKPKKGLDAVPEEKVEPKKDDKPKEEPKAKSDEPEVDTSKWQKPQAEAFVAMRQAKRRAEEQAKDAQIRYEKLQKEFDAHKASPKDRPETLEKLQQLESWQKAQELTSTPEWVDTVEKPIQKSLDLLNRIAGRAKVDADALIKATDEELDFERIDAITKVFEAAEEPPPAHLISAAIEEARKLHPLYAKASEMKQKAQEVLAGLSHQSEQQKAAAAKAAEAEYEKHHTHIYDQMAKKLPSIFGDEAIAAEVRSARPGTDPADRAYEAQAGALLPKLVEKLFALQADFKREQAAKLALLGTRATVNPTPAPTSKPASDDDVEMDEEAFAAALPVRRR